MLTFAPVRPLPALILCALLLCALTLPVRAATLYVSPKGSDDNSGAIASPYKTIQAAVNNASTGDTIALAYAIYQGNGNRDIDFAGKSLSIVSQSGPGKAIIDCQGTQEAQHYAFNFHSKEKNILLDGLTIKNGNSQAAVRVGDCTIKLNKCGFRDNTGGCVFNGGTATLTDCLFLSNSNGCVSNRGAATLTGCTFTNNKSEYSGGAVLNGNGCTAMLTGCTFTNNKSEYGGGVNNAGTATLIDCTFASNICGSYGGGMNNGGTATVVKCAFIGNTSNGSGGGVENENLFGPGVLIVTGCTFTDNTSDRGGGISNRSSLILTNCIISSNTATGNGGGLLNTGHAIIRFCSISGNIAKASTDARTIAQGGGLENDATAILTNDILWGNTAANAAEIGTPADGNQTTTVTYCDIQGGLSGTGNIKANPGFADAANGDLHLQAGSPCRGAGITIGPAKADPNNSNAKPDPGVTTDADGQKRPSPPSIGAYEYSANPPKRKKVLTLDVGTVAAPGAAPQVPGIQFTQDHPALAAPPVGPQPRLDPQQENAAFLQLMVTLNTGHYAPSDMAQRIQTELDRGADINVKDGEGFPAIVTAASLSHADVVQVLLEKGADASRATEQGGKSGAADSNSILHKTANGYQVDIGSAISGLFAKKPKPLSGQTALMLAAQAGQAEMVTLLLAHHADSHAKDSRGKSALDYAAQNHRADIAQVMKAQEAR